MPVACRLYVRKAAYLTILLAALISAALVWSGSKTVRAAGTVATCNEANLLAALAGGGEVTFTCSGTITLTTTPLTGIVISSNTTLDATGQSVTISGNNDRRIFFVNNGVTLSLNNLTLTNASPPLQNPQNPESRLDGGAIYIEDNGALISQGVQFVNNTGGQGGAIYADTGSNLLINNSTFNDNHSVYFGGGAIYFNGSNAQINKTTFTGNTTAGEGGALYGGPFIITDSGFVNNQAVEAGGAIHTGSAQIVNTTFFNNSVTGTGSSGGAISVASGSLGVFESAFYNNQATALSGSGGAINSYSSNTAIGQSYFQGNAAESQGGAIQFSGGTATIFNSTFYSNSASQGGAIFSTSANAQIYNVTFSNNSAGAANYGGALAGNGVAGTLFNTIVANSPVGGNCATSANYTDGGNNLEYPGNTCEFTNNAVLADPLLQPPGSNGGWTPTMRLAYNSPAIDAGSNAVCAAAPVNNLDQRGATRPFDGNYDGTAVCDIGAYEFDLLRPTLAKSFPPDTIGAGGTATLRFDIGNPNIQLLHNISFQDNLPAEIRVAANPAIVNNCPFPFGSVTAPAGGGQITVSGVGLGTNQSCFITVNVTSAAVGQWTNTVNQISSSQTGPSPVAASAVLTVINAPSVTKSFGPSSIKPGETSRLSFVVAAPAGLGFTNISFQDNLPAQIRVAATPDLSNGCAGSTVTATAGGGQINVSGVNLAAGQSCTISLNVTATAPGTWTNTTGPISSNEAGQVSTSNSAILTVISPAAANAPAADLVAQLRVSPDRVAANDPENLITYEFRLKNIGPGTAANVKIVFPIDPQLSVGYATLNDPQVWVSEVAADNLTVTLPPLTTNSVISGTLTFRPNATTPPAPGSGVFTRYRVLYADPTGGGKERVSNAVAYVFGAPGSNLDVSKGEIQLMNPANLSGAAGTRHEVKANFFIPGEIVTAWLTRPDGTSTELGGGRADHNGEFTIAVDTAGLAPGSYVVASYGQRSEVYGSSLLEVGASANSGSLKAQAQAQAARQLTLPNIRGKALSPKLAPAADKPRK